MSRESKILWIPGEDIDPRERSLVERSLVQASLTERNRLAMNMRWVLIAAIFVVSVTPSLHAQDKPKEQPRATQATAPETDFRIQVVLSEFDGSKKISSLPYMIRTTSLIAKLRTGARIPVVTTKGGDSSFQYLDIGTNIDCSVRPSDDGKYSLDFVVERSSVYFPGAGNTKREWSPGDPVPPEDPLILSFRSDFRMLLRDGQTEEGTTMTDPLTGHVIKVEVTLNVVK